jgi:hypothetical protein
MSAVIFANLTGAGDGRSFFCIAIFGNQRQLLTPPPTWYDFVCAPLFWAPNERLWFKLVFRSDNSHESRLDERKGQSDTMFTE